MDSLLQGLHIGPSTLGIDVPVVAVLGDGLPEVGHRVGKVGLAHHAVEGSVG